MGGDGRGDEGEKVCARERGGPSGVQGAEMVHVRERWERWGIKCGKASRERERGVRAGSEGPRGCT